MLHRAHANGDAGDASGGGGGGGGSADADAASAGAGAAGDGAAAAAAARAAPWAYAQQPLRRADVAWMMDGGHGRHTTNGGGAAAPPPPPGWHMHGVPPASSGAIALPGLRVPYSMVAAGWQPSPTGDTGASWDAARWTACAPHDAAHTSSGAGGAAAPAAEPAAPAAAARVAGFGVAGMLGGARFIGRDGAIVLPPPRLIVTPLAFPSPWPQQQQQQQGPAQPPAARPVPVSPAQQQQQPTTVFEY
jgi:hypothetical protein